MLNIQSEILIFIEMKFNFIFIEFRYNLSISALTVKKTKKNHPFWIFNNKRVFLKTRFFSMVVITQHLFIFFSVIYFIIILPKTMLYNKLRHLNFFFNQQHFYQRSKNEISHGNTTLFFQIP